MLKFLRKYQMYVLAVGGVLLMIVFVAPQAVQQFGPNPMMRAVGTLDGKEITALELQRAQAELYAMERFIPGTIGQLGIEQNDDVHWLLITRAAERAGLVGGKGEAEEMLLLFASDAANRSGAQPGTPEYETAYANALANLATARQSLAGGMRIQGDRAGDNPLDRFDMALAKALGAQRLLGAYYSAPKLSEARMLRAGRDLNDRAIADILYVPAEAATIEWTPTNEILEAHLEKYRDVRPGEAEDGTPFGYVLPQRVRLRWMMVERDLIRTAVNVDPVEVRKRWQLDQETYGDDFAAARTTVANEIREEETDRILNDIDRLVRSEILAATRRLESEGNYKVLPPEWEEIRPGFGDIASKIVTLVSEQTGVSIRPPGAGVTPDWTTLSELGQLPLVGRASATIGSRRFGLPALVSQLREFGVETPLALIQVGIPVAEPSLTDATGNRFYFVVEDFRPESGPESLAEVRGRVLEDARRLAGYEAIKQRLPEMLNSALSEDLQPVADAINAASPETTNARDRARVVGRVQIRRSFTLGPAELAAPAIRDAVLGRAKEIDPRLRGDDIPASDRYVPIEIPSQLGVAIAEITEVTPLTREDVARLTPSIVSRAVSDAFAAVLPANDNGALSKDALMKRMNWVPAESERSEDDAPMS